MTPLRRALLSLLMLCTLAACGSDATRVRVAEGEARGMVQGGVRVFRSLPYATAPVGALRWARTTTSATLGRRTQRNRARSALHTEHGGRRLGAMDRQPHAAWPSQRGLLDVERLDACSFRKRTSAGDVLDFGRRLH